MKERNIGIDLLKIISMFMITILHTINRGQAILNAKGDTYTTLYILEIACFCCVNTYALCSGYVNIDSKFRPSRLLYIYFEVIFYTILCYLIYSPFHAELLGEECIKYTFLPITSSHYWYISAYFILFPFMPIINYVIKKLNKWITFSILVLLIIPFTILPYTTLLGQFFMGYGYSATWLMYLYMVGAFIKEKMPLKKMNFIIPLAVYVLMIVITYILKLKGVKGFLNYNSITIFIEGVALFYLFTNINIKNDFIKRSISFISKLTLGIYIIHVNYFVWRVQVNGFSNDVGNLKPLNALLKTLLNSLKIFGPCLLIEAIRYLLFEALHIKTLFSYIDKPFILIENKLIKKNTI